MPDVPANRRRASASKAMSAPIVRVVAAACWVPNLLVAEWLVRAMHGAVFQRNAFESG